MELQRSQSELVTHQFFFLKEGDKVVKQKNVQVQEDVE